jgi:7-cyano-7-deazaguanine synthase
VEIGKTMTVLLLSGGMDSIAVAWWKRPALAITIDYGQRAAAAEISASRSVCQAMKIRHEVFSLNCSALGSGDMAGSEPTSLAPVPEWWPFRNQLILTLAGMAAVRFGMSDLMIGTLFSDGAHADGREEFINGISGLMSLQEGGITVSAPAIYMDAVMLVRESGVPQELLAWAHSCHIGNYACGACRGCIKHYKTWESLGWEPH